MGRVDLTYLPVEDRTTSLAAIDAAMLRIAERIEAGIPGAKVNPSRSADEKIVTKLILRAGGVQIKIETTPVLHGTVYDPAIKRCKSVARKAKRMVKCEIRVGDWRP
jgi:hypothetical protein